LILIGAAKAYDWIWAPDLPRHDAAAAIPFDPDYTDDPELQAEIAYWRSIFGDGWPDHYDTDWPRDTRLTAD
jgi:hypothetical protein